MSKFAEGFRDGDGKDPRFDRNEFAKKPGNRKALQLCAQVQQALTLAIGSLRDERAANLSVVSVRPNPDSMHMLVTVAGDGDLGALIAASGWLRSEVAASINRKKTPELRFAMEKTDEGVVPAAG